MRRHVGVENLTHDEDIVAPSDRIRLHQDGIEHAIRRTAGCLLCRRTVEAPDGWLFAVGNDLGLRSNVGGRFAPVDPDVLSSICHSSLLVRGGSAGRESQ